VRPDALRHDWKRAQRSPRTDIPQLAVVVVVSGLVVLWVQAMKAAAEGEGDILRESIALERTGSRDAPSLDSPTAAMPSAALPPSSTPVDPAPLPPPVKPLPATNAPPMPPAHSRKLALAAAASSKPREEPADPPAQPPAVEAAASAVSEQVSAAPAAAPEEGAGSSR
jgi:hypothetical protein